MIKEIYPEDYKVAPPEINKWHKGFNEIVDLASRASGKLLPFARHVAAGEALTYPAASEIDQQYIQGLDTPYGSKDYDEIFGIAVENVKSVWELVARAIFRNDDAYLSEIRNCDLDTGIDISAKRFRFWSQPQ
jgi:hypothetical protein